MKVTEEKLHIILITYNRDKYLTRTLDTVLADDSPVKGCDILIIDNNSSDDTRSHVANIMKAHPNVTYRKNKYNVGISGNIAKAMEAADKEYYWILADDDVYDWSNWFEVDHAMSRGEDIIIIARYAISDALKHNVASQMLQCTFVPGSIVRTSLLNDTVMRNVVDTVDTLFPHLCPIIRQINRKKDIYVISKGIVDNGMDGVVDISYTRGQNRDELFKRTIKMTWHLGYAGICTGLNDKVVREEVFMLGIDYILGDFDKFLEHVEKTISDEDSAPLLEELALALNDEYRTIFRQRLMGR